MHPRPNDHVREAVLLARLTFPSEDVASDGHHHGRARTESSFPQRTTSRFAVFFPLTLTGPFSSFTFPPSLELCSLSFPRLSFFPSLFDSMDPTGFNLEMVLFFFLTRPLNCKHYFFIVSYLSQLSFSLQLSLSF